MGCLLLNDKCKKKIVEMTFDPYHSQFARKGPRKASSTQINCQIAMLCVGLSPQVFGMQCTVICKLHAHNHVVLFLYICGL